MDESIHTQEVFATFVGELNQASVKQLAGQLCAVTQNGVARLHLMLQTTGGSVAEGIYLHNFLGVFPTPLTLYNGGSVCSAGVLAFLAVKDRHVSKTGSFMVHRCLTTQQGVNAGALEAATGSLAIDDARMDSILKALIDLTPQEWNQYDHHFLWLDAKRSVECGIASAIGDFHPPLGTPVFAFG